MIETRDRPAGEVEVTEAMIAAGIEALSGFFIGIAEGREHDQRRAVNEIFNQMSVVQKKVFP